MSTVTKPNSEAKPRAIAKAKAEAKPRAIAKPKAAGKKRGSIRASEASLVRSICRESFYEFVKEFWSVVIPEDPIWNWHIEYLCGEFQKDAERVFAGKPKLHDTICNISPGTTKSTILSVMAPAWVHTRMPSARWMAASHTKSLTLNLGRLSRQIQLCPLYRSAFHEVVPSDDQYTKSQYMNTAGGGRFAATVGGMSPTGFHAHFISVDDPLDPMQAAATSGAEIDSANNFVSEVLPSRKVDKAVAVTWYIMQRLHQNDVTGFLLEQNKDKLRHICIPATKSVHVRPRSLRKYYIDGLMDPVRLGKQVLKEAEADLGSFGFAGQYDQHPVPRGGGMFKTHMINLGQPPPSNHPGWVSKCRFWDKAGCLDKFSPVSVFDPIDRSIQYKYISDVRVGDLAITRSGPRRVIWSGISGYVDKLTTVLFDDSSTLTGTPDHPIWNESEKSWVHLEELLDGSNFLMDEDTFANQGVVTSTTISSIKPWAVTCLDHYTGIFGKTHMGKSPMVVISITSTETGIIISWRISNASRLSNIELSTRITCEVQKLLRKFGLRLPYGRLIGHAKGVKPRSVLELLERNTVNRVELPKSCMLPVEDALSSSKQQIGRNGFVSGIARNDIIGDNAIIYDIMGDRVPVYDLTVEGEHEFFANDLLVHNTRGGGAFTAGLLMGRFRPSSSPSDGSEDQWWIIDVVRDQLDAGEREKFIQQTAIMDTKRVRVGLEQEPGSGGKESAQATVRRLSGFRTKVITATGSKEDRADSWAALVNMGAFYMKPGDWNKDFIDEMKYFPHGRFKDQIDAGSGAHAVCSHYHRRVGAAL